MVDQAYPEVEDRAILFRCGECDFQVSGPSLFGIRREFYRHMEFMHVGQYQKSYREELIGRYRRWAK